MQRQPGDIKKFLKILLLFSLPFWAILFLYVKQDPFCVLKKYSNYYSSGYDFITLNKDYVSTEVFKNNYPEAQFNSFILGSSRSMFYETNCWNHHIEKDASILHFDASGESLYGIYNKLKFLSDKGVKIKNALLIFDTELLAKTENSEGYLFIKHPDISHGSAFKFQSEFLKTFLTWNFLSAYLDFSFTKNYKPYMKNVLKIKREIEYNPTSNEFHFKEIENWIKHDSLDYYNYMKSAFYKRENKEITDNPVLTTDLHRNMLQEVKKMLDKNNTNYKIIISPLYNQKKINIADLSLIQKIFEPRSVYNFWGKNYLTESKGNYYENSHYRPRIAKLILDSIYKN